MTIAALLIAALVSSTPDIRATQSEASAALARIPSGTLIRIGLAGGEQLEGRLHTVTADSLLLAGPGGERWVAVHRIEELHERGRATKTAAIVGAAAGSVAGASVVTFACSIGRADDGVIGNEDKWADCALVGAALGGAGGALVGAGVGSLIPKWHVRFRSAR